MKTRSLGLFFWPLLLVFLCSCGTIKKGRGVVPVDSFPRGLSLYDEKGTLLGETPFFLEVESSFYQEFSYEWQGKTERIPYSCGPNWASAIVPDSLLLPAFPIGTAISAGFLVVDSLTGGIVSCHKPIQIVKMPQDKKYREKDRVYMLLPVLTSYEDDSDEIIERWSQKIFPKQKHKRSKLIDFQKIKHALYFRGITHDRKRSLKDIQRRKFDLPASQNKATHLIQLQVEEDGNSVKVTPIVYDIFTLQEVQSDFKAVAFKNILKGRTFFRTVKDLIKVLPNAVSFSVDAATFATYQSKEQNELIRKTAQRHPDAFPEFFALFGVESIDHPQRYNPTDFNFNFGPSIGIGAWKVVRPDQYSLQLVNFHFAGNANATLHTPLGAFVAQAGLGPIIIDAEDSLALKYTQVRMAFRLSGSYYAFFNDNWFFKIDYLFTRPQKSINNHLIELKSWEQISAGIGFTWPKLSSFINGMLGR